MDLKDHFLLAMPGLAGDYFADSLIYVCEHTDQGSMGLIVNRPTDVSLLELIASLGLQAEHGLAQIAVYEGGPVATEQAMVLHSADRSVGSSAEIASGICLASAMDIFEAVVRGAAPEHIITALGYAGWGAGQLEGEITDNIWLTIPATTQILFSTPATDKANAAASTLGIDMRFLARPGHA